MLTSKMFCKCFVYKYMCHPEVSSIANILQTEGGEEELEGGDQVLYVVESMKLEDISDKDSGFALIAGTSEVCGGLPPFVYLVIPYNLDVAWHCLIYLCWCTV